MLADKVQSFIQRYRSFTARLALRPEKPHLYLRAVLRLMQHITSIELFTALKELVS
jgi:hypothetical protein